MRPQVFIEKIMPVKLLNQQVYYEHGGNPFKGLHRWYSRKPLSFSRASVLASILPAEITMEQFLYIMGIYGQDDVDFWEKSKLSEDEKDRLRNTKEVRLYKCPPNDKQIAKMEELCQQIWGTTKPSILDAFAGGGSIPFEGVRYGLNVFASDLNPVAVITMKAAMEYPLKFGKSLQKDIDKWVKFVGDEAQKRLAEFFPSPPQPPPSKSIDSPPITNPPFKRGGIRCRKSPPFSKGKL
jgi:putative DNA methylase